MSNTNRFRKDPDDVVDFALNWATHLADLGDGSDTIDTSTWSIETANSGLAIETDAFTDTTTTVWLSGGLDNYREYDVRNRIVTAGGRTLDQVIIIKTGSRR
jgi:hypothetical protein